MKFGVYSTKNTWCVRRDRIHARAFRKYDPKAVSYGAAYGAEVTTRMHAHTSINVASVPAETRWQHEP
jgi:hypothetical protein